MVRASDESGSMLVDVLIALAIIAIAIVAARSFFHGPTVGNGVAVADVILGDVERIRARALAQNTSQSIIVTPNTNGTTTLALISGHLPTATVIESRTLQAAITSSVQGASTTTPFMVTALPGGTITIATAATMQTATSPPACPATPTISFQGYAYAVDCSGGRITPPSSLTSYAKTAKE